MRLLPGLLLVSIFLTACEVHTERNRDPKDMMRLGESIYWEYCAECHQRDGGGWSTIYPNLAGNPIVTLHDPEPIITIVLNGQGSMPNFRNRLTSVEIAAVLTYIRNTWGNEAPSVSARIIR